MNITTQFFSNILFWNKIMDFLCLHAFDMVLNSWLIDQSIESLRSRKYISNWNISKRLWTESGQIKAKNIFQNKIRPQNNETTGNLSLDKFGGVHYLGVLRNSWTICKRKGQIMQKMRKKKKEMYFLEVAKNGTWKVKLCLLCDYCDDFLRSEIND